MGRGDEQRCHRCSGAITVVSAADLPAALVESARRWAEFLQTVADHPGGIDSLHQRPNPDTWSAVEYACHVRDLMAATTRNLELVLLVDCPELREVDGEAMLRDGTYWAHDPTAVAQDIGHVTTELAGLIQRHDADALERIGACAGALVSGLALCRAALHEAVHHLGDARRGVPMPVP